MALVSVIVPNYNHSKYLKKRIDSVLQQDYENIEVFILDDNSTDSSKSIIESYRGHSKIKSLAYNSKNSGSVFSQWKKGLDLASGKFIWIAESDDFAAPNFLSNMVNVMEKNHAVVFAYANSAVVDEHDRPLGRTLSEDRSLGGDYWRESYTKNGLQQLSESLGSWCSVNNASATLFRADILKQLSFDIEKFRFAGDWAVYVYLATKGNIAYEHNVLSYYREHVGNTSKSSKLGGRIYLEHYLVLKILLQGLPTVERYKFLRKRCYVILESLGNVPKNTLVKLLFKQFIVDPVLFTKCTWLILLNKLKHNK